MNSESDLPRTNTRLWVRTASEHTQARIKPVDLQQMIWRVIWPLIVLLAVSVFGLLYKVLTS